ncbi:MAG: bifunctional UDP-N-acetylglucosamine diphosphorylase/glucosamine-1-phosphate N-acetyltransferase GlmU [Proteobacteria bacterium]|nr:bifunctional UDP-N-acetylglucosamine diphosphorylase/glucosamine-1-phosphate N-acetyltransferase GlmU [Pseudomonadota bacterium]
MTNIAAIVLAAGQGTRMNSGLPKILHPIAGRQMVLCVLDELAQLKPEKVVVVVAPGMEAVETIIKAHKLNPKIAIQSKAQGTGDAVKAAEKALGRSTGPVLILFGDSPLMRATTFRKMCSALSRKAKPAVAILGFQPADTEQYGRLDFDAQGDVAGITEFRDLADPDAASPVCNGGAMAVDGRQLFPLLKQIRNRNAKKEFYLTDIVGLAIKSGRSCTWVEADPEEPTGVNSRVELAYAEALMQERLREKALAGGVTMLDPTTVYLSYDTKLGRDVMIEPNVFIGPGVRIGDGVSIRAFSHIEGATVARDVTIGPFARLRPGAALAESVHIGNFVEVKAAKVEQGAKINHLSYIGDARVGEGANIGAGTITCNYDGTNKHHTDIGAGAFIGSNTALVAPVRVGDGAVTGAGSVIARDVPANALALTRAEQKHIAGWAKRRKVRKPKASPKAKR